MFDHRRCYQTACDSLSLSRTSQEFDQVPHIEMTLELNGH